MIRGVVSTVRRHMIKTVVFVWGLVLAIGGAIGDVGIVFAVGGLLAAGAFGQIVTYAIVGADPEGAI